MARKRVGPRRAKAREQREASHLGTEGRGKRAETRDKRQERTNIGIETITYGRAQKSVCQSVSERREKSFMGSRPRRTTTTRGR